MSCLVFFFSPEWDLFHLTGIEFHMNLILIDILRINVEATSSCTFECAGAYCQIQRGAAYVDPLKTRAVLCKHRRIEALIKTCPFLLEDREMCIICFWLLKLGIL